MSLRRLTTATVYVIVVLAFFEMSSRAFLSRKDLFRRVAGVDEASSRLRWAARQDRRPLTQPFDIYHPVRGWTLRPGLRDEAAFGGVQLSSNERGYRGAGEVSESNPPGQRRVAVLGDSFTFGEDVGDEQTWVHQLGVLNSGLEPVNLGVHAYGHDQMLLTLREEGPWLRPDLVLLGFVHIDLERNRTTFLDYAKPRFELKGDELLLRNVPVPTPDELRRREPWRSKFLDLLSMLRARLNDRSGREARERDALGRALLGAVRDTAVEIGARPVFVYLPILGEIGAAEPSEGERFFEGACRDLALECVNLRPAFHRRVRDGQHLKRRGHWGPVEHRAAAEDLLRLGAGLLEAGNDVEVREAPHEGVGPGLP